MRWGCARGGGSLAQKTDVCAGHAWSACQGPDLAAGCPSYAPNNLAGLAGLASPYSGKVGRAAVASLPMPTATCPCASPGRLPAAPTAVRPVDVRRVQQVLQQRVKGHRQIPQVPDTGGVGALVWEFGKC